MDKTDLTAERDDILRDLDALAETAVTCNGKTFAVRSDTVGVAGRIAQSIGVRLPNTASSTASRTPTARIPESFHQPNHTAHNRHVVTKPFARSIAN